MTCKMGQKAFHWKFFLGQRDAMLKEGKIPYGHPDIVKPNRNDKRQYSTLRYACEAVKKSI